MTISKGTTLPRLSETHIERYRSKGVWRDETLVDMFTDAVTEHPESTITGPKRSLDYDELQREVKAVSAGLQEIGIEAGDVVSYQLPNWVTTNVFHLAILHVGAIANPIIPIYREREVSYILSDAGSDCIVFPEVYNGFNYGEMIDEIAPEISTLDRAVVVGNADGPEIDAVSYDDVASSDPETFDPPAVSADDIHALLYTSGTTSDPKGVVHTANTLLYKLRNILDLWGLSAETTVFNPSPVTHISGMCYALEMPFMRGMDLVLMNEWDPEEAISLIDAQGCNFTVAATPFLRGLTDAAPADWDSSLRVFGCGGAGISPNLIREATDVLGCSVFRGYGSTEFPALTMMPLDAPLEKMAETDGPPDTDVRMKIVDLDTREELPPGEEGEIIAHGPELMVGYLGDELNEGAFDGEWFETGDIAVMDEDGYIEIVGRKKDIIIRGGENIPIKDVEDRLNEHPAVVEVAVVAMPDPEMQEKGCAYVKTKDGKEFTFEEMVSYLESEGIAKQKFPERLENVEEFPMTSSGKIRKTELREDIADKLGMDPVTRG